MRSILRLVSVTTLAAALAAVPGSAQKTTGPKERYEMDVATASGFAAMAAGGKPGLGSAMSMMFGGGPEGKVAHTLELRLGSNPGPTRPPVRVDHIVEPTTKRRRSLQLVASDTRKAQNPKNGTNTKKEQRSVETNK